MKNFLDLVTKKKVEEEEDEEEGWKGSRGIGRERENKKKIEKFKTFVKR